MTAAVADPLQMLFAGLVVDALFGTYPTSIRVLQLRREVVHQQGELTEVARTAHRMFRLTPNEAKTLIRLLKKVYL